MNKNNSIDSKIKVSFDNSNRKLPRDLWQNISETISASDPVNDKIKNSFESIGNNQVPDKIWNGINKELNIDKSWLKIKRRLDIITFYRKSRKYAALLLLLFTFGYGGIKFWGNSNITVDENVFLNTTQTNFTDSYKNSPDNSAQERNNVFPESLKEKQNKTFTSNKTNLNGGNDLVFSQVLKSNKIIALERNDADPYDTVNVKYFPKITFNSVQNNISKIDLTSKTEKPKKARKNWEIGIISHLSRTWILNNETKESYDSESLILSNPGNHSKLGLLFTYNISKNHAVNLYLYNKEQFSQHYQTYQRGRYINKSLALIYRKTGLSYQLNLMHFHTKYFDSQFNLKGGLFYAWLKQGKYLQLSEKEEVSDSYSNQFGSLFQMGQDLMLDQVIVSYGLNFEHGLNNIYAGNNYSPADFNFTNNFNFGGYLSLKLKF